MKAHPRYNPASAKTLTEAQRRRKGDSPQFAMIRKSCKFGLEYVTKILPNGATIHFLLNDMPAEQEIINKTKLGNARKNNLRVPITVSEIRWLFRNWPDVHAPVRF